MGWLRPSVSVRDDGFDTSKCLSRRSMSWESVVSVYGEKIDKVTYDELFVIIESDDGDHVAIGELDLGFDNFETSLKRNLADFPATWRDELERIAPGQRVRVWQRRPSGQAPV